jgi:hypothetical protein
MVGNDGVYVNDGLTPKGSKEKVIFLFFSVFPAIFPCSYVEPAWVWMSSSWRGARPVWKIKPGPSGGGGPLINRFLLYVYFCSGNTPVQYHILRDACPSDRST